MIPREEQLDYCVMFEGRIADGCGGLAMGTTERAAWDRYNGGEDWAIAKSKAHGAYIRRCVVVVLNP